MKEYLLKLWMNENPKLKGLSRFLIVLGAAVTAAHTQFPGVPAVDHTYVYLSTLAGWLGLEFSQDRNK